ncbi:Alpha-(1,3)-fucosyltransferase C [Aphelenchoides fujianensis]|nr:Alpha-(1,3)-fucosyltransferase C [Aphelenchoides fujianensis]
MAARLGRLAGAFWKPKGLLVLLLAGCGLLFVRFRLNFDDEHLSSRNETPLVLFWKAGDREQLLRSFERSADCPHACVFTADPADAERAAVHVLHACAYDVPSPPPTHPLRVHLMGESPHNSHEWTGDPAYFNATVSYRSTATIFRPYGRFVARDGGERPADVWSEREVKAAIGRKKAAVLLAISNCSPHFAPSGRLAYAAALERHIAVTRVGGCFGRRVSDEELAALVADHHFFLAFENSVCPEYTTEKFWRLKDLIVPVVLSRGAVNPHEVPNGTFVAASDFRTPRELAAHLHFLIQNKREYENGIALPDGDGLHKLEAFRERMWTR